VVSPGATSPTVAELDDGQLIWRTCPSDTLQAKVLAQQIPTSAKLDIVNVGANAAYAIGLTQAFVSAWHGTVDQSITLDAGQAVDAVIKLAARAPTHALAIVDLDAPALVAAVHGSTALATTRFFMTDAALGPALWGSAPWDFAFLGRIRGTAPGVPADPDPSAGIYRSFAAGYRDSFGDDPGSVAFVANAYDAFWVLALAARAAGDHRDGAAVAANLGRLSSKAAGTVVVPVGPNGFLAGVNGLAGGGAIDLVGASGAIDFEADGDVATAPIEIWSITEGDDATPGFTIVGVVTP
jgi:branched-chain amino acid transport system substrate-binding protein